MIAHVLHQRLNWVDDLEVEDLLELPQDARGLFKKLYRSS